MSAQTNTINAPQRRKIELNRRQKILLFAFLPFWVILGTVGMTYGFIGDNSNEVTTTNPNQINMPVANAKITPIEETEKKGSSLDELNPTSVSRNSDNLAFQGSFNENESTNLGNLSPNSGDLISGRDKNASPRSNSFSYEQEKGIQNRFDAIERNTDQNLKRQAYGFTASNQPNRQLKTSINQENLAYVNRSGYDNSRLINEIYSGKPTEDYQRKLNQEAVVKSEREARQDKYDDMLLKMVDNENKRIEKQTNNPTANPFNNGSTNQIPAFARNNRKASTTKVKSDDEIFEDALNGIPPKQTTGSLVKADGGSPQIVSAKAENAFFGLNGKRTEVNKKRTRYEAVEGVIHGSGDGVSVTNGSTVKIRILSETKLQLQGEELSLQPNTLITGICSISGDRIMIKVTNLRIDNYLYPVSMQVYDLDGQQGVYVKDLAQKTQLNSALVHSASQSVQPSYLISQGSVGNQVGTQIATNTLQSVSNVGRNILTTKIAQVKAFIRPNYRVLLKFQEFDAKP
ncbi:uncharacterized protein DUF3714 [Arcicella aurantiaca]|uniref:Uncharacterized protein DUF3714 n=1 Tax=Arcicella aurantiaca TaxID=591202 RepID=A0A316DGP7_9BACT|nr:conjugative transposon protein TraM [Arcicella aurantiaca]PWK16788.1 uncharacterized protein DUF3714 [Arcicella aurantiaca]